MIWPTYPTQDSGIGRLYQAFQQAGDAGLDRVTMARVFYVAAEPTSKQVEGISSGNARLREWLGRYDLTIVPNAPMGQWATRFRVEPIKKAAIPVTPASLPDEVPSQHARKIIAGQAISLPRLSFLDGSAPEARPC